jgi:membrane-associated phospholipid phosphatase
MVDFLIRVAADYTIIPIVLIGAYALVFKIPKERRFKAYTRVLLAGLTAYLLSKLVGSIWQPDGMRPFELLGKVAGASYLQNAGFPSDHVLFATAITCAVWFETKQKVLTWILAGLVVIVGVGRVLALVHTPLDVIGGVIFALFGALWYLNSKE